LFKEEKIVVNCNTYFKAAVGRNRLKGVNLKT